MAPLVIPEKYLLKQTNDNKEKILELIKRRILQNKKTNPKNLRDGLPKPFLYGGEVVQIKNVSAFARGERSVQVSRITDAKKEREALLRAMTDKTGAAAKTAYGRGARKLFRNQEDHHIIFRNLLDNFYKNLDPDDADELTAHLARRGSPVGNVIENLQGIDIDLHDSKMPGSLHQWARNMKIDSKSFPDLTNLDLDARTAAIDDWLDLIEEPLLDRTATTLSRQDYRRWGTKGLPKPTKGFKDRPNSISKEAWKEYLTNQRENVKSRANLLDKYPILAEDLDSPNIRPELKARYEKALSLIPEEDLKTFKALTSEQNKHALAWFNDNERVAEVRANRLKAMPSNVETFEPGRRLGGIHDTMKVGGGLRRTDQALNLGTNIATGNVAGAAVGGGVLAASEILKNPAAQKAIAGQVARLGASRAGKTMMKTIPGLDVLISGGEAMSYLSQGRLDQAGIATLSGAIGWIPIVGDGAAAALDLTNTGLDISRLQGSPTQTPRKKKKIKWGNQPTTRLKFGI